MNLTRYFAGIAFAFALLCIQATARAQVVVIPIGVDGYVTRNAPDAAFTLDTSGTLAYAAARTINFFGDPDFQEARSLFEWNLSSIPAGANITGVSLNFYVGATGSSFAFEGYRPVSFFGYSGEGILTVADAEAGASVPIFSGALTNEALGGIRTIGLDPTFVQNALDSGAFAGLNLRMLASRFAYVGIITQENPDSRVFSAPSLTVTYTPTVSAAAPEPSAYCLLLSGLVVCGTMARRRIAGR